MKSYHPWPGKVNLQVYFENYVLKYNMFKLKVALFCVYLFQTSYK